MLGSVINELKIRPGKSTKVDGCLCNRPVSLFDLAAYNVVIGIGKSIGCRGLIVTGVGLSLYGYREKCLILFGYGKGGYVLGSVINELKIRPGKLIKVDGCGSNFPGKVSNLAGYGITLGSGKGNLCLIGTNVDTGNVGVVSGQAVGNVYKYGTKCGSGRIVGKSTGYILPLEVRNVDSKNALVDLPLKSLYLATYDVVAVLGSECSGSGILTDIGFGVAVVGKDNALGGVCSILKSYGVGVTVMLDSAGVIPLCPTDVNGLGVDLPFLRKADDRGLKLAVFGVKAVTVVDTDDLCNVLARLGILIVFVNEGYVRDAVCIYAVDITGIGVFGGSGPLYVIGRDNLLCDGNGDNVRGNCLCNDTLCNGNYAIVFTAVGNVNNVKGIGSAKGDVAVCINLIPLVCIGCICGIADNLYSRGVTVIGLFNVTAYTEGEFLVNDGGKNDVTVGHLGNEVAVFVNPSNDGLAIKLGNGGKEFDVLVLDTCREEALANKLVICNVLNSLDLCKVDVDINGCGHFLQIDEGCNKRTVLLGNLGKECLDVNGMSSLVSESAVALIEIHKRSVVKLFGDGDASKTCIKEADGKILCLIEIALVFLYLCDDLFIGKVRKVNVSLYDISGENVVKVNKLEKCDNILEGKVAVVKLEFLYGSGASLEYLELKLFGNAIGHTSLKHCLMEELGHSDVEGIYTVNNRDINVIRDDSCNGSDLIKAAANLCGEVKAYIAVFGVNKNVIGELHLFVGHLCDLCEGGDILYKGLECGSINLDVSVTKVAVYEVTVDGYTLDIGDKLLDSEVGSLGLELENSILEAECKRVLKALYGVIEISIAYAGAENECEYFVARILAGSGRSGKVNKLADLIGNSTGKGIKLFLVLGIVFVKIAKDVHQGFDNLFHGKELGNLFLKGLYKRLVPDKVFNYVGEKLLVLVNVFGICVFLFTLVSVIGKEGVYDLIYDKVVFTGMISVIILDNEFNRIVNKMSVLFRMSIIIADKVINEMSKDSGNVVNVTLYVSGTHLFDKGIDNVIVLAVIGCGIVVISIEAVADLGKDIFISVVNRCGGICNILCKGLKELVNGGVYNGVILCLERLGKAVVILEGVNDLGTNVGNNDLACDGVDIAVCLAKRFTILAVSGGNALFSKLFVDLCRYLCIDVLEEERLCTGRALSVCDVCVNVCAYLFVKFVVDKAVNVSVTGSTIAEIVGGKVVNVIVYALFDEGIKLCISVGRAVHVILYRGFDNVDNGILKIIIDVGVSGGKGSYVLGDGSLYFGFDKRIVFVMLAVCISLDRGLCNSGDLVNDNVNKLLVHFGAVLDMILVIKEHIVKELMNGIVKKLVDGSLLVISIGNEVGDKIVNKSSDLCIDKLFDLACGSGIKLITGYGILFSVSGKLILYILADLVIDKIGNEVEKIVGSGRVVGNVLKSDVLYVLCNLAVDEVEKISGKALCLCHRIAVHKPGYVISGILVKSFGDLILKGFVNLCLDIIGAVLLKLVEGDESALYRGDDKVTGIGTKSGDDIPILVVKSTLKELHVSFIGALDILKSLKLEALDIIVDSTHPNGFDIKSVGCGNIKGGRIIRSAEHLILELIDNDKLCSVKDGVKKLLYLRFIKFKQRTNVGVKSYGKIMLIVNYLTPTRVD